MTNKLICPDDGRECIYPKQQEEVRFHFCCWNCPKIQELLEKMKEVDESGEKQTQ